MESVSSKYGLGLATVSKALISNSTILYLRVMLDVDGDFIAQWRELSPKDKDALKEDARIEMNQPHNVLARERLAVQRLEKK